MKVIFVLFSIELAIYIQKLNHLNSNVVFVLVLNQEGTAGSNSNGYSQIPNMITTGMGQSNSPPYHSVLEIIFS